jgi:hypothetical protein
VSHRPIAFPDPRTLGCFLLYTTDAFWKQVRCVNERLLQIPSQWSGLIFDLDSIVF